MLKRLRCCITEAGLFLPVPAAEWIRRDAIGTITVSPNPIKTYYIAPEIARIDELMQRLSAVSLLDLWIREGRRK